MIDDRLDAFSEEDVSSPQCIDKLTSDMSYERSEVETYENEFSHGKSTVAESQGMLG